MRLAVLLNQRQLSVLILLGIVVSITGCSSEPPVGTVSGNVTSNGKVYADAAVMFVDLSTGQGGGVDINSDGSFTIPDPIPVGSYTAYLTPRSIAEEDATAAPIPIQMDKSIPGKYWGESSSDLKFEVKEGKNDFPIDLKK